MPTIKCALFVRSKLVILRFVEAYPRIPNRATPPNLILMSNNIFSLTIVRDIGHFLLYPV